MPSLNHDEPIDSVEHAAEHALKMGWLEKEAEESILGGWSRRFVVLTGWDGQEAHLFYYRSETDKEASGILFVSEMDIERSDDPRVFTLQVALPVGCCVCNVSEADSTDLPQGSQRRFRFRSDSAEMARQWLTAIEEVKGNGPHQCKTGEACLAWRKDKHAKTCQHCKRIFSVTIGKHHCRCCGRIFCNDCSNLDRVSLEPYSRPVRCCNQCNTNQQRLMGKRLEMRQRAKAFVARYLDLLETGCVFNDPDRIDVRRNIQLDRAEGISLQYRQLAITQTCDGDAMADAITSQAVTGGRSLASSIKSMTLRVRDKVRGVKDIRGEDITRAFEREQARQNLHHAGQAVGSFAVNTGGAVVGVAGTVLKSTAGLAKSVVDTFKGQEIHFVAIKDIVAVSDCAADPALLTKYKHKAALCFVLTYHDMSDGGALCDCMQVCSNEDEKDAWVAALTELRLLAQDAVANTETCLLVYKREQEESNRRITDDIKRRKEHRRSKVETEYRAQTLRDNGTDLEPRHLPLHDTHAGARIGTATHRPSGSGLPSRTSPPPPPSSASPLSSASPFDPPDAEAQAPAAMSPQSTLKSPTLRERMFGR